MLGKLGSPRKGSRFAASAEKNDPKELSSLSGGAAASGAEAKSPPTSPTKKRLSMWSKKTPTTATTEAPLTSLNAPKGNELALNLPIASMAVSSIQEHPDDEVNADVATDEKATSPRPLKRSPRQRSILEEGKVATEEKAASPMPRKRSPRQRSILEEADAKPTPSPPEQHEEKKKRPSKRDSLGLKSLMTKRESPNLRVQTPKATAKSPSKPEEKSSPDAVESPTKKKTSDETLDPPLSPIRRQPRRSSDGLDPRASTTATIREAKLLLNRKSITGTNGVPPMQQPEVHIIGEIVGGDGFGKPSDGYCCKWSVDYGNQWIHIAGDQIGQTQIDYAGSLTPDEGAIVWAHPIDLHFATTALHGWPKLLLQVWRVDSNMKMNVVGYGFVHLPFAPGHHRLSVSMWRPMETTKEEFGAALLGHTPELLTDEVLFNKAWAERCRLKTIATGRVHVSVGIIVRNFETGPVQLDM